MNGRRFGALWAGQTVSAFGSSLSFVALPVTAVLVVHAGAPEMALLVVAESLPYVLLSLAAGVTTDRLSRKGLAVGADLARGLCLATIPAAAIASHLTFAHLVVVAVLMSSLDVFAGPAQSALVPSLVTADHLPVANARLAASSSVAGLVGPGLGGALIQLLTAPVTLLIDAVSYLVAGVATLWTRPERHEIPTRRAGVASEAWVGLMFVVRQPVLRVAVAASAAQQLGGGIMDALRFLYLLKGLSMSPVVVGAMFTCAAASATAASLLVPKLLRRLGAGRSIVLAALAIGVGWSAVPLAGGPAPLPTATLLAGGLLFGAGNTLINVTDETVRQWLTPSHLLGRVAATSVLTMWGPLLIGAALGGLLGVAAGLRGGLLIGAAILLAGALVALPLWRAQVGPATSR